MNKPKTHKNLIKFRDAVREAGISDNKFKELQNEARYEYWLKKIKKIRESQNTTQQEISDKTGIPRPAISRIENGYRNVTIDTLIQISKALNLELVIDFRDVQR